MAKSPPEPAMDRLLAIMARLRDPVAGCPWDREQSFATIAPYTIEEAYEVADAIGCGDMAALKGELGDLLFQVVFHARMAEEKGEFGFTEVAAAIADKMERRHPHVFGDARVTSAEAQTLAWEGHKAAERAAEGFGALDGVALALPALMRAHKLQSRAARVGFDWGALPPVVAKIREEIDEIEDAVAEGAGPERLEDEVGDLLFAVANLARHLGFDPEAALRRANAKFERRFRGIERRLAERGKTPVQSDLAEMDALWDAVKRAERGDS